MRRRNKKDTSARDPPIAHAADQAEDTGGITREEGGRQEGGNTDDDDHQGKDDDGGNVDGGQGGDDADEGGRVPQEQEDDEPPPQEDDENHADGETGGSDEDEEDTREKKKAQTDEAKEDEIRSPSAAASPDTAVIEKNVEAAKAAVEEVRTRNLKKVNKRELQAEALKQAELLAKVQEDLQRERHKNRELLAKNKQADAQADTQDAARPSTPEGRVSLNRTLKKSLVGPIETYLLQHHYTLQERFEYTAADFPLVERTEDEISSYYLEGMAFYDKNWHELRDDVARIIQVWNNGADATHGMIKYLDQNFPSGHGERFIAWMRARRLPASRPSYLTEEIMASPALMYAQWSKEDHMAMTNARHLVVHRLYEQAVRRQCGDEINTYLTFVATLRTFAQRRDARLATIAQRDAEVKYRMKAEHYMPAPPTDPQQVKNYGPYIGPIVRQVYAYYNAIIKRLLTTTDELQVPALDYPAKVLTVVYARTMFKLGYPYLDEPVQGDEWTIPAPDVSLAFKVVQHQPRAVRAAITATEANKNLKATAKEKAKKAATSAAAAVAKPASPITSADGTSSVGSTMRTLLEAAAKGKDAQQHWEGAIKALEVENPKDPMVIQYRKDPKSFIRICRDTIQRRMSAYKRIQAAPNKPRHNLLQRDLWHTDDDGDSYGYDPESAEQLARRARFEDDNMDEKEILERLTNPGVPPLPEYDSLGRLRRWYIVLARESPHNDQQYDIIGDDFMKVHNHKVWVKPYGHLRKRIGNRDPHIWLGRRFNELPTTSTNREDADLLDDMLDKADELLGDEYSSSANSSNDPLEESDDDHDWIPDPDDHVGSGTYRSPPVAYRQPPPEEGGGEQKYTHWQMTRHRRARQVKRQGGASGPPGPPGGGPPSDDSSDEDGSYHPRGNRGGKGDGGRRNSPPPPRRHGASGPSRRGGGDGPPSDDDDDGDGNDDPFEYAGRVARQLARAGGGVGRQPIIFNHYGSRSSGQHKVSTSQMEPFDSTVDTPDVHLGRLATQISLQAVPDHLWVPFLVSTIPEVNSAHGELGAMKRHHGETHKDHFARVCAAFREHFKPTASQVNNNKNRLANIMKHPSENLIFDFKPRFDTAWKTAYGTSTVTRDQAQERMRLFINALEPDIVDRARGSNKDSLRHSGQSWDNWCKDLESFYIERNNLLSREGDARQIARIARHQQHAADDGQHMHVRANITIPHTGVDGKIKQIAPWARDPFQTPPQYMVPPAYYPSATPYAPLPYHQQPAANQPPHHQPAANQQHRQQGKRGQKRHPNQWTKQSEQIQQLQEQIEAMHGAKESPAAAAKEEPTQPPAKKPRGNPAAPPAPAPGTDYRKGPPAGAFHSRAIKAQGAGPDNYANRPSPGPCTDPEGRNRGCSMGHDWSRCWRNPASRSHKPNMVNQTGPSAMTLVPGYQLGDERKPRPEANTTSTQ